MLSLVLKISPPQHLIHTFSVPWSYLLKRHLTWVLFISSVYHLSLHLILHLCSVTKFIVSFSHCIYHVFCTSVLSMWLFSYFLFFTHGPVNRPLFTGNPCSVMLVWRVIHIPDCHSTQPNPFFIRFSSFKPWPLSSIRLSDQDLTSHLWRTAHLVTPNLLLIVSLPNHGCWCFLLLFF